VGGYYQSSAGSYHEFGGLVVFIARRGEITFRELLQVSKPTVAMNSGLSFRKRPFPTQSRSSVAALKAVRYGFPTAGRVLSGYVLGRQVDVVETSRGCTFDCSFCSIIAMPGRQFHIVRWIRYSRTFAMPDHGVRTIFLVPIILPLT
jgi:radical SAM superfamily enzyme YgiQ (UPF0313 family)